MHAVMDLRAAITDERASEPGARQRVDAALETLALAARTTHSRVELIFAMNDAGLTLEQQTKVLHDLESPTAEASTQKVLAELVKERAYQDTRWGGKAFDDANTERDWAAFILHYLALGLTARLGAVPGRPFREAMLKVAALAVAAIEAEDRRHAADAEEK